MPQHGPDDENAITFPDVEVVREGALALLCRIRGKDVWIPRTRAVRTPHAGESGSLVIPRSLAREKGLIA
jgi:hypothetical protein